MVHAAALISVFLAPS